MFNLFYLVMFAYLVYSVSPDDFQVYQSFLKQNNLDFAPNKLHSLGACIFDVCIDADKVKRSVENLSKLVSSYRFVYVPFVCDSFANLNIPDE